MKKIVAIIVIIAGFVVSASLFALASVAPSIAKMQASQQAFTLGGTLNPGETGLQSAPIAGKKAGDTLTAEEWNRVLEMLADGTGGGGSVASTAFYYCSNADSVDTSNIPCYEAAQNQGAGTQRYRIVSCNATSGPRTYTASSILNFGSLVANKWAFSVNGGTIECTDNTMVVVDLEASVSSGSGGGSGWVDVPLSDTNNFDTSCIYRAYSLNQYYYMSVVNPTRVYWYSTGSWNIYIDKGAKSVFVDDSANPNLTVTKLEKLCGGGLSNVGGSNGGSAAFYYCTNAESLDPSNAPCYGASRDQGLGDGRYRVVSCHIVGSTGHESINSQLLNFGRTNLASMQNKWNSLYTDSQWQACVDGSVLVVDTQATGGGGGSTPGGTQEVICGGYMEKYGNGYVSGSAWGCASPDSSSVACPSGYVDIKSSAPTINLAEQVHLCVLEYAGGGAGVGGGGSGGSSLDPKYTKWPDGVICDDGTSWEKLYQMFVQSDGTIWYGAAGHSDSTALKYDNTTGAYVGAANSPSIRGFSGCQNKSLVELETFGMTFNMIK